MVEFLVHVRPSDWVKTIWPRVRLDHTPVQTIKITSGIYAGKLLFTPDALIPFLLELTAFIDVGWLGCQELQVVDLTLLICG